MNVGEKVFVHPVNSFAFGGRWGRITSIDPTERLPFSVLLNNNTVPYNFDRNELWDEQTYLSYLARHPYAVTLDGDKVRIKKAVSPSEVHTDSGVFHARQLAPITRCRSCNTPTTGLFSDFCEECEFPSP